MRILRLVRLVAAINLGFLSSAGMAHAALVCSKPAIVGLEDRIANIHGLLGEGTTDPTQIKMFLTRGKGGVYLQSNYFAEGVASASGSRSGNPIKILCDADEHISFRTMVKNVLFTGMEKSEDFPSDVERRVDLAIHAMVVFIDPSTIKPDGRPELDLTGVKEIHLANDHQSIATGQIDTIDLPDPPPALTEVIDGCCLRGRPPGFSTQILQRLGTKSFDKHNTALMSLVIDSGTSGIISASPTLSKMSRGPVSEATDFKAALTSQFSKAEGGSLILLTHMVGGDVVVESSSGEPLFNISVKELHAMAEEREVTLLLIGCDSASQAAQGGLGVGVAGTYDTAFAAKRIEAAMQNSTNGKEFLAALATHGLTVVAQATNTGVHTSGAAVYRTPKTKSGFWRRIFRVYLLGRA